MTDAINGLDWLLFAGLSYYAARTCWWVVLAWRYRRHEYVHVRGWRVVESRPPRTNKETDG